MRALNLLGGLVPLCYPILVHVAIVTGSALLRFAALGVLVLNVLGPWLLRRRALAWLAAVVLVGAAALVIRSADADAFFYATPVLVCLALAWFFGRTLMAGRTPLITALAHAIRGPLPLPVARYTRAVTGVWCAIMLVMALADLLLALFAPAVVWSLCTNFLNYLIVAVLFVLEWIVRQRLIGEYEHLTWRGYLAALRHIDYRRLTHG